MNDDVTTVYGRHPQTFIVEPGFTYPPESREEWKRWAESSLSGVTGDLKKVWADGEIVYDSDDGSAT